MEKLKAFFNKNALIVGGVALAIGGIIGYMVGKPKTPKKP